MNDAVLGFTLTMNGYTESDVVDVDLSDLSDNEIRVIANLTEFSEDRIRELRKDGVVPCRSCGEPTHTGGDPPICRGCYRGDGDE